ncbi:MULTISPECIES: HD domain-containing phosphohydrolase [Dethiosulfovibrio]|uniref:CHASE2 domain-containing protein n=2 Tax=Dethiosulfovibrio TaxID=47054 RepID=A0ABS9ERY8_9BACT|nr:MULTISPECIES: HD domain-containing phosphohydrolase [Dethiosulfovibrio]MCF4114170.1 CHASE2 domain-containing protein [Dethiosulfovibrio russensis]MCF4142640.1 CHASE2 domain-containing protein [Dethiosulfovibrio marinus]MCF4145159.1 CHASE2 domain-containing protein [Dethiosulfovibrio acidaminovorans]
MRHTKYLRSKGLLLLIVTTFGTILAMYPLDMFVRLDRILMDRYTDYLAPPEMKDRIILVLAQEPSFMELGGWPWPRSVHGRLLTQLHDARTVVLDMIFPEKSVSWQDRFLAEKVAEQGNCVVAYHLTEQNGTVDPVLPYRDLVLSAKSFGVANVIPDVDGLYRFLVPLWTVGERSQPSLPLAAAIAHGEEPLTISKEAGRATLMLGDRAFPINDGGGIWITHRPLEEIPVYEYSDVLAGRVPKDAFEDALVVVGVNAAGLGIQDTVSLYSQGVVRPIPGASFVALSIATLLDPGGIRSVPRRYETLLSVFSILCCGAIGLLAPPIWSWVVVSIMVIGTTTIPFILLSLWGLWLSPGTAVVLGLSSYLISVAYRLLGLSRSARMGALYSNLLASITFGAWKNGDIGKSPETVLDRVWPEIDKLTSIKLIRKHVSSRVVSEVMKRGEVISQDDGTSLVKLPGDSERYHMFIKPPSGWEGLVELGWTGEISEEDLGSAVAVVLTACWFSVALQREQQRAQAIQGAIKAIVAAVDAKDQDTRGHSDRVASLSRELAMAMDLSDDFVEELYLGATLHDVGKIGIPDAILQKPDKLTEEEYGRIKEHPSIGRDIMATVTLSEVAKKALLEHHEKLDGSGYPLGLKGEEISLAGRIVAVADTFDALSSRRSYKEGWDLKDILELFDRDSGTLFDPQVVEALHRIGPSWYERNHRDI